MSAPQLETVLRSATKEVVIGHGRRFCLIGERINPTGRRIFQEQLRAGDLSAIERDVKAQVEGGADVPDINMGVPLTDEADLLAALAASRSALQAPPAAFVGWPQQPALAWPHQPQPPQQHEQVWQPQQPAPLQVPQQPAQQQQYWQDGPPTHDPWGRPLPPPGW